MARQGEKHHKARLTERAVRGMRNLHYFSGYSIKMLARMYGVAYVTAWDAINYNTWKHVRD